ncbi:hypothetical protein A3762_13145 [Oleiphilus sp. HI0125]|uniref:DUF4124 domain-containing protein n=1 Tax=Oleiphilus sp. HI0125 TaxID=1822266 RepID=UPI0007C1FCB5|nr:DUF4124 domain-containing protein [Oleiphilus sp. HI0125]KZZ62631.1 hypothetical protein A3762_13145 [Oleiphilus sp. HI0125]
MPNRRNKNLYLIACTFSIMLTNFAHGQVYKWVDDEGKTHFGDRPPTGTSATNISDDIQPLNISTDLSNPEMVKNAKEQWRAEKIQAAEQKILLEKQNAEIQAAKKKYCEEAAKRLADIQGPVVFYDEHGEFVKVTEQEREQREKDLRAEIQRTCK